VLWVVHDEIHPVHGSFALTVRVVAEKSDNIAAGGFYPARVGVGLQAEHSSYLPVH